MKQPDPTEAEEQPKPPIEDMPDEPHPAPADEEEQEEPEPEPMSPEDAAKDPTVDDEEDDDPAKA